jgi:hypothetical protein
MSELQVLTPQPAPSPARQPLQAVAGINAAAAASTTATDPTDTTIATTPSKAKLPHTHPACFVCCEPCVAGSTAHIRSRQDAEAIVCRLTVNGVRVALGQPFTSVVRGNHYARHSAFDCHACGASVCCLCMCRRLLAGNQYVARHPLTCACGEVTLVNETTVLFLTPEQEHSLYIRCDEWCCPDPLYCPVPKCSAYIPMLPCLLAFGKSKRASASTGSSIGSSTTPRLLAPRVSCVRCDMPICTQCKGRADDEAHCADKGKDGDERKPCTRPNVHRDKDVERVIQETGYRKW